MFTYTLKCVSIYIDDRGVIMNNKGFTLIELLAVIIILLGIASVSVFNISSSLKRNEEQECEIQKERVMNAAKIYFSLQDDASLTTVSVNTLISGEYLKKEDTKLLKNASVRNNNGEMVINGSCTS